MYYIVFLLVQVYENVFKCGSWCFPLRACLVTPKTRTWTVRALVSYLPNKGCFREANETNNRVVRALLSPSVWVIRVGCSVDDLHILITCWQYINGKIGVFFQTKGCNFYLFVAAKVLNQYCKDLFIFTNLMLASSSVSTLLILYFHIRAGISLVSNGSHKYLVIY